MTLWVSLRAPGWLLKGMQLLYKQSLCFKSSSPPLVVAVAAAEVAVCVYMGDVTVRAELSEVSSLLLLRVEKMELRFPSLHSKHF